MFHFSCFWQFTMTFMRSNGQPPLSCWRLHSLVRQFVLRAYCTTAMVKLYTHPWHTMDNATFEREAECWFANMCTIKCGGLETIGGRKVEVHFHRFRLAPDLEGWDQVVQESLPNWLMMRFPLCCFLGFGEGTWAIANLQSLQLRCILCHRTQSSLD